MRMRVVLVKLLAGAALGLAATSAGADDSNRWTGVYFGAGFGGGWTNLDTNRVTNDLYTTQSGNRDPGGALTGTSALTERVNSTASGSGRKWGGAFGDFFLGYSARLSQGWVAGIQAEGGLADMSFRARGTGVRTSSSTSVDTNLA